MQTSLDKEAQADTISLTNPGTWQKWYQTEESCQLTDSKNIYGYNAYITAEI